MNMKTNIIKELEVLISIDDSIRYKRAIKSVQRGDYDDTIAESSHMRISDLVDMIVDLVNIK